MNGESMRTRISIVVAVVISVLVLAGAAGAVRYYYAAETHQITLSFSSPTECQPAWGTGCAQNGFWNWDWSGMYKASGEGVTLGFRDTGGNFYWTGLYYGFAYNGMDFHVTRAGTGAPAYNRAFCGFWTGTQSSVQCWADIH
jgi:hypothetical protein